jgi:hypothetical protein
VHPPKLVRAGVRPGALAAALTALHAGTAAPAGGRKAVSAVFSELRHAATVVRATQNAATLLESEAAFAAAFAAWTETRGRMDAYLREHHAAKLARLHVRLRVAVRLTCWPLSVRLQARFVGAEEEAARSCPTAVALWREQRALLSARQFVQAFDHLKRVKAAEAKARSRRGCQPRCWSVDALRVVHAGCGQAPPVR